MGKKEFICNSIEKNSEKILPPAHLIKKQTNPAAESPPSRSHVRCDPAGHFQYRGAEKPLIHAD